MRITVAIPVRNGGPLLGEVLAAVLAQQIAEGDELEVLVCDSGSSDGSVALARACGATVIEIPSESFSHGGTRNLLIERASGELVALLTQDAVPAGRDWLGAFLKALEAEPAAGLAYGPYVPRVGASPMVARELTDWFESLSPSGAVRVDRLSGADRGLPVRDLMGRLGFFTSANACMRREAWLRVPFRDVPYAEDHALAHDMLRSGYAKLFVPDARVIHSHDYGLLNWLRRSFDEARAVSEIYGFAEGGQIRRLRRSVWGSVGADLRWDRTRRDQHALADLRLLVRSTLHHTARATGTGFGSRAAYLPAAVTRLLSLEQRA